MNIPMIRSITPDDAAWIGAFIREQWHADIVVAHGTAYEPVRLPGFVADYAGEHVGLLTYLVEGDACEVVSINSTRPGLGIGKALIDAIRNEASGLNCRRLWLITTNDNLDALRFYQRCGFQIVAVHPNALDRSRELKPMIPLVGAYGIPLRDELELEMILA